MLAGDPVDLMRQLDNLQDHSVVAIFTTTSRTCVGYLGPVKAQWIGAKMDRGFAVSAVVDRIRGTGLNGSPVWLVLRINMEGEDPEAPTGVRTDQRVSADAAPW